MELVIATNPDPDSQLRYLLRVPLGDGLVFRTSGTWPREKALYCYPVPAEEWPADPQVVERIGLRSCARRGAAINLVAARGRENRSQLVFTQARGRDAVFWQSPKTRKTARPHVRLPAARAAGLAGLEIVVDSHERYPYRFAHQQATTLRRALPAGDYGIVLHGRLVAAVERKSLPDLVSSLTSGNLSYQLADLASLPRAAVVVEDRYSQRSSRTGYARRSWPTGWPRSGPTGTSPPPTSGPATTRPPRPGSASRSARSTPHPPSAGRRPDARRRPRSAPGPAPITSRSPTAAGGPDPL